MDISIVFPCYNEEKNLKRLLHDWNNELKSMNINYELIVVDDCSTDNSYNLLVELSEQYPHLCVLKNEKNSKYGITVLKGIKASNGHYILWTDSDYSHPPSDFRKLWSMKDAYDAVWGIRSITKRDTKSRVFFTICNIVFTLIVFQVFLKDPNCAFKLYKRKALFPVLDLIDVDPLMTTTKISIKSIQKKLSIKQIPVQFFKRAEGTTTISGFRSAKRGVQEMIKFKMTGR